MSYVIDFNQDQQPHYILRVRGSSSGIIDLAGNTVTNYGVDYSSTASTFGNGTALKFNGSSYAQVSVNEIINNNEDFTISAWIKYSTYSTSGENATNILSVNVEETSGLTPWEEGTIWFWQNRTPGVDNIPSISWKVKDNQFQHKGTLTSEPTNTWIHAAMCRKRNTLYLFRNGTLYHTENNLIGKLLVLTLPVTLGHTRRYKNRPTLNGYLDDVCIIKGKALWTSSFTPPSTYLPDDLS